SIPVNAARPAPLHPPQVNGDNHPNGILVGQYGTSSVISQVGGSVNMDTSALSAQPTRFPGIYGPLIKLATPKIKIKLVQPSKDSAFIIECENSQSMLTYF